MMQYNPTDSTFKEDDLKRNKVMTDPGKPEIHFK
jgi:hypothetical protein